jgi:hypothetical protein
VPAGAGVRELDNLRLLPALLSRTRSSFLSSSKTNFLGREAPVVSFMGVDCHRPSHGGNGVCLTIR